MHEEPHSVASKLSVLSRNCDVIEEDINLGVPARNRDGLIKQETCPQICPTANDEQCSARRQRLHRVLLPNTQVCRTGPHHGSHLATKLLGRFHLGLVIPACLILCIHVATHLRLSASRQPFSLIPLRYRSSGADAPRSRRVGSTLRTAPTFLKLAEPLGLVRLKEVIDLVRVNAGKGACRKRREEACGCRGLWPSSGLPLSGELIRSATTASLIGAE